MEQIFLTYGPLAIFLLLLLSGFGVPLGEDLIIIPAGVLVGSGRIGPWWLVALCAYSGVVVADNLWFFICRRYGTPLLHKRWFKRSLHPRRLLQAKHQIEQRGAWVIVLARFIPGSRTPVISMAGMLHMPWWKFLTAELCCVAITTPLQLTLGYLISRGVGTEDTAKMIMTVLAVMMLMVGVMLGVNWYIQMRASASRAPRAKAVWLRRFRVPRPRVPRLRRRDGDNTRKDASDSRRFES